MASDQPWTVGRLLTWTTEFLQKHGVDSPRLDAEILLAHARGSSRIQLYTAYEEIVDEAARAKFRELVKQRSGGMPVAYLVGKKEFYSLPFIVTRDVLIPRPETEHVVIAALDIAKTLPEGPIEIADVGVGSGAIAVTLARHLPRAKITAFDVNPAALAVARQNAAANGVTGQIEYVESDVLDTVAKDRTFDLIVSNPPYVTEAEWERLAVDVWKHEPKVALVGGPTGLEITSRLVKAAAERLRPGGWLVMEIHSGMEQQVYDLLSASGAFEHRDDPAIRIPLACRPPRGPGQAARVGAPPPRGHRASSRRSACAPSTPAAATGSRRTSRRASRTCERSFSTWRASRPARCSSTSSQF